MVDISIIISIYNVEKYLTECLTSVEKLMNKVDSELLLIDDGSTDDSARIAQSFSSKIENCSFFQLKHKGVSAARNYGLDRAIGKYIMFVDGDDIIVPEVYEEMLDIANTNELNLVRCNYVNIKNGTVVQSPFGNRAMLNIEKPISTLEECPNMAYDTPSWNKIIRRSVFEDNNIRYPEGVVLNEDAPVMLKTFYYSGKCATYFKTGYLWRIRTESGEKSGSATQNTQEMKSFIGKMKTEDECLCFCKEKNADELYNKLLWDFLSFKSHLPGFLLKTNQIDEQEANQRITHIQSFLSNHNYSDIMSTLPIAIQQMLSCVEVGDIDKLVTVANFNSAGIPSCPVVYGEDNKAEMLVPKELFGVDRTSAKKEFIDKIPTMSITEAEIEGEKLLLHGHLYMNRVETSKEHPQQVDAFLLNCINNKRIDLETKTELTNYLSQLNGLSIYRWDYSSRKYNYDFNGFCIVIDPLQLLNEETGFYSLHLKYSNDIYSGTTAARGTSANTKGVMKKWCVIHNGKQITTWIDRSGIVFISVAKENKDNKDKNKKKAKAKTIKSFPIGKKYKIALVRK